MLEKFKAIWQFSLKKNELNPKFSKVKQTFVCGNFLIGQYDRISVFQRKTKDIKTVISKYFIGRFSYST